MEDSRVDFRPRVYAAADEAFDAIHGATPGPAIVAMGLIARMVAAPAFLAGWLAEVVIQSYRNGRSSA